MTWAPLGEALPLIVSLSSWGEHIPAGMLALFSVTDICHSRGWFVSSTMKSNCQFPSTIASHSAWLGSVGPSAWLTRFPGESVSTDPLQPLSAFPETCPTTSPAGYESPDAICHWIGMKIFIESMRWLPAGTLWTVVVFA